MTEESGDSWFGDEDRLLAELQGLQARELPAPIVEGYEELREIGRGGQGIVYRALATATGEPVAVKVLREPPTSPAERGRFEREVELLARLSHPGIVRVLDHGVAADGRAYLAMDLVEGLPFDEFAGRSSVDGIVHAVIDVCAAVQHAHQRGVLHRDLKPGNVRVDRGGRSFVLDFGLAKPIGIPAGTDLVSRSGLFLGSLPWASPEQLGGDPDAVDVRSDVYSLGVMLYTALCGNPPFPADAGIRETIHHITETRPARPTREGRPLPGDLAAISLGCLEKDPSRRYQSAGEFARDLERFLAGEPIDAQAPSFGYLARTWMSRHRAITAVVSIACIGTLLSGIALWNLYRRSVVAEAQARAGAEKFAAVNEYLLGTILSNPEDGERKVAAAVRAAAKGIDDHDGFLNPLFRAEAHNAVAYWISSLGDKREAWRHHEVAMKLRLEELDPTHPDLTAHYRTLAFFREYHEDYRGAIEFMEQALANMALEESPRASTRAWVLRVIGRSRLRLGDYAAAEVALRESLAVERQIRKAGASEVSECLKLLSEVEALRR